MPLVSEHFKRNARLQRCLVSDPDHVFEGQLGEHVALIQAALIQLGSAVISANEIAREYYGPSTAQAVLKFKGPPRNILNIQLRETKPDPIVGKLTIAQLDKEMAEFDKPTYSRLISPTRNGAPHNHAACPRLEAGLHVGTPINPLGWKRKVNIYGDGETNYLGFQDYAIDPKWQSKPSGGMSPLTWWSPAQGGVDDQSVSDLCMRSSPVYDDNDLKKGFITPRSTTAEIKRIMMPGGRITYTGDNENLSRYFHKIARLAAIIEKNYIDDNGNLLPNNIIPAEYDYIAYVLTFLG